MLQITFVKTGKTVDFSADEPADVVANLIRGNREPILVHLEDVMVAADYETGTMAALNQLDVDCARKTGISPQLIEDLLALAINDEESYDDIEEFFEDFGVRFVP
jgi:hypothetical protein